MLIVLGAGGVLAQEAVNFDWVSFLERFGLPVALLVIVLVTGASRKWVWGYQLRDAESRCADAEAEVRRLRDAQLTREQQLNAAMAPRIYDSAVLYRDAAAAQSAPGGHDDRVEHLAEAVEQLVERLNTIGPGDRPARGGVEAAGRSDPGGTGTGQGRAGPPPATGG